MPISCAIPAAFTDRLASSAASFYTARSSFRDVFAMRAEAQAYADSIKQALDLLRRFL
jgi:hypothetical protein